MLVFQNPNNPESNKVVLPPLIPPFRFNIVEGRNRSEALYRSAYPTEKNYRYLKRLKLKTIVSLVPRNELEESLKQFCEKENIQHEHYPVSSSQSPLNVKEEDYNAPAPTQSFCAEILTICIDPEKLPLLVHCTNGAHVTGLIISILRRLQNLSPDSYLEEFIRFTKYKVLDEDERTFLAKFFHEITLPKTIPSWLWGGQHLSRHPTLPLFGAAVSAGITAAEEEQQLFPLQAPSPVPPSPSNNNNNMGNTLNRNLLLSSVGDNNNNISSSSGNNNKVLLKKAHSTGGPDNIPSAEILAMLTNDESTDNNNNYGDNRDLKGLVLEEPSSFMRRRTTS